MSEQRKPGRPTKYRPEFASQAEKLCRLGATNEDIADFFGVAVSCIHRWRDTHTEFRDALKDGKDRADAEVARALFLRATGYSHPDIHVSNYQGDVTITPITKHYPPDTTACIFWLKNRRPDLWRDKQEVKHSGGIEFTRIERVVVDSLPAGHVDGVTRRMKALDEQDVPQGAA